MSDDTGDNQIGEVLVSSITDLSTLLFNLGSLLPHQLVRTLKVMFTVIG